MRPHGSAQELEDRRFEAIAMLKSGLLPVEVAKQIGVNRRSVRRWKALYHHYGLEALKSKWAIKGFHRFTAK